MNARAVRDNGHQWTILSLHLPSRRKHRADHTNDVDVYRHLSACFTCPLRARCTPTKLRRMRWENEDLPTECRLGSTACPTPWACDDRPSSTRFGTLKAWMGS